MKGLLLNYKFGMWDAVVTGRKTNTRRSHACLTKINEDPDKYEFIGFNFDDQGTYARFKEISHGNIIECRARYQISEIVFLQEPTMNAAPYVTNEDTIMYQYRDKEGHTELDAFRAVIDAAKAKGAEWSNKMFMPANRARYHVKINRIEMERLHDISDKDCLAEGIETNLVDGEPFSYAFKENGKMSCYSTPKKAYFALYNGVNQGDHGNLWVFSYHFELCTING